LRLGLSGLTSGACVDAARLGGGKHIGGKPGIVRRHAERFEYACRKLVLPLDGVSPQVCGHEFSPINSIS
jgi:hypothetical protein